MPKTSAKTTTPPADTSPVARFETSLGELEQLVARLEGGELNLDQSLQAFERGVALYRSCQAALEQAQARVAVLLDPEHPESARPLASPDAESPADTPDADVPF